MEVALVPSESEGAIKTYVGKGKNAELKLMGEIELEQGKLTVNNAHIQGGGKRTSRN